MSWWQFWKGGKKEGEVGLGFTREQLAAIHREQQEMGKTGEQTVRAEGQEFSGEQLLEYQKLQQLLGGINANTTTPQALRKPLTPSLDTTVGSSPVEGMGANSRNSQGMRQEIGQQPSLPQETEVSDKQVAIAKILRQVDGLNSVGNYEEAIIHNDQALAMNPDGDLAFVAWSLKGIVLVNLGRYEEAIVSYDKAIEIKPDKHDAWYNRGGALMNLGRHEEAIASYDKAIEIKPDYHEAWNNRGGTLMKLGRHEEAIASYDKAIEIKPDFHDAWINRGGALMKLGRHEEEIASYDKAIEIKPDFHDAWINRGFAVGNLSRNYRTALGRPLIYSSQNPAIDQCGYSGEVANYRQGLEFCQQDTHPEGWGELHWWMGKAHYFQGKNQEAPFRLFREARREYDLALETLTEDAFPETYLKVMQDYLKVYRVLEPANLEGVGQIAYDCSELLQKLIKLNPSRKESLQRKFIGFGQITVDLMLQSGEVVQALEQVEKGKAVCLDWMLPPREPLTWTEMQNQRLDPAEAWIYWYYSPLELHTILLLPQQAPQLIATTPVDDLEKFLTTWNEQYSDYTGKDKTKETIDETWRQELPNHLTNLTEILSIEKTLSLLSKHNIQNLTLIPHRDLHRLPLHALGFPPQIKIRYLPTLYLKGNLGGSSGQQRRLLSVEAPDSIDKHGYPMFNLSYAALESAYICQIIGEPLQRIANTAATKDVVNQALHQGCQIFHFSGHAGYRFEEPLKSALCLSQKDRLDIADIVQIPLDRCELVCLSACETGLTGKQTILDEYVGLVSAFLAQGVGTVVSTLWQVKSESSAVAMIEFYRRLHHPENPQDKITALQNMIDWLRTVTVGDLIAWWADLKTELCQESKIIDNLERIGIEEDIEELIENTLAKQEPTFQPYSHPYHWATFIITGG